MKTVTYKGNVYEIGNPYLFSDDEDNWYPGYLTGIDGDLLRPFFTNGSQWEFIKEIPLVGKITPAPVELINGQAYMFDHCGKESIGLYESVNKTITSNEHCLHYSMVNNIRKMVVAP